MAGFAGKVSEVKLWGRGGCWARHRSVACKGRQAARRDYSRTSRRLARVELARYAGEGPETFAPIPAGEDHDAHVAAYCDFFYDELYGYDFDDDGYGDLADLARTEREYALEDIDRWLDGATAHADWIGYDYPSAGHRDAAE